jgi:hypothetical protein
MLKKIYPQVIQFLQRKWGLTHWEWSERMMLLAVKLARPLVMLLLLEENIGRMYSRELVAIF